MSVLDRIRIGLLGLGLLFVATGLLPAGEALGQMERIAPILLFLGAVVILAELTKEAQVFDVIATRMAAAGRGNYVALFLLCTAFASLVTMFLNLDTTAVLLTPVMLALAARTGIAALPLAMTTVWLANTASLLLPISNLTNLLAMERLDMSVQEFAGRLWFPQLVSIAVTMVFLWVFFWRRGSAAPTATTRRSPSRSPTRCCSVRRPWCACCSSPPSCWSCRSRWPPWPPRC
ncbi:SLC13 family permease [Streptosporangium lutulentum]